MKISLNNTKRIDNYILGKLSPGDKLVFDAQLLLSKELRLALHFQRKIHAIIKMYHRKKMKEEMEILHQELFKNPQKTVFQQSIYQLFKSQNL